MAALDKSMYLAQPYCPRNKPVSPDAWYMAGVVVLLAMLAAVCLYGALSYQERYPITDMRMETTNAQ